MKTQHSRRVRAAIGLGIASAVVLGGCAGGGAPATDDGFAPDDEELVFVDGVLQPLSDGFPSSQLRFIVVDEAGSNDGIYARNLAEAAKPFSPVDIAVEDRPEFGSTYGAWEAIDWASQQRGGDEGYYSVVVTIPGATIDLIATPVGVDLGVGIEDMNTTLLTESVPYVFVTRKDAPWGTDFAAMLEYSKTNEVKYISRGPGSGPDLSMQYYANIAGATFNTSVGGSHDEILTAIGAGVGDIAVTLPGAASPFVQDGTVEFMTCSGSENPCAANWGTDVPNAATFLGIDGDTWGTNRGMAPPAGIPESHHRWLEALMLAAVDTDSFIEARSSIPGTGLVKIRREESFEVARTAYTLAFDLLEELGQVSPGVERLD